MKKLLNHLVYAVFLAVAVPTGMLMIACCLLKELSDKLENTEK